MNRDQAYTLVQQTFTQSFDKNQFLQFVRNLVNHLDESKAAGMVVPAAFTPHIRSCWRLGTYQSPEGELTDVLIVHTTAPHKIERTRTGLRDFVAHKLKRQDSYKEAGLVAFVSPDARTWRFSYIRMEYESKRDPKTGKIMPEERLTPARRFSYIVGEGESCHTAQTRFLGLLQDTETDPALADIEEAFSVEAVTKEFFTQYVELFQEIYTALDKLAAKDKAIRDEFTAKGVNTVDFGKKLMGQIVFLYFLQKKGWLGVAREQDWGSGPRDFLRRLAKGEYGPYANFFNDVLEPLFYDELATDRGHAAWCNRFNCRMPFLNGGLFEPLGDYDWLKTDILLPNKFFTNQDFIEEGITGSGVLDVFDRYNFTVNEAEPLEKEVAIDPEMLGKVFENLIEDNRRKGLGAYYTPREIVHYMCQESLINYLDTALNPSQTFEVSKTSKVLVPRADLETLIHLGDQAAYYEAARMSGTKSYKPELPDSLQTHARLIDDKLADIAVCDPAVGSGAFPVGMMTEIVRARSALTPYFNDIHERTPYQFKRHAIQNCLYGVDIDAGAVEIAKLRLWLSLVVDEEDVKRIKPLPNLDYKIVAGNSLLGFPFKSQKQGEIETLKQEFFDETDHAKKAQLKAQVDKLLAECFAASKKSLGYEVNFDFEILFSEVFNRKSGFDVVIGNPPYVQLQKEGGALAKLYQDARFTTFAHTGDIYALFYEKGYQVLSSTGHLCYITSNKWMRASYGKALREFLTRHTTIKILLDFGDAPLFANATTYTNVLLFSKEHIPTFACHVFDLSHKTDLKENLPAYLNSLSGQFIPEFSSERYLIVRRAEANIKQKVEHLGIPLQEWDIEIYRGILTGHNQAFIIDGATRAALIAADPKSAQIVKPILRGRDIKRYEIDFQDLWLINSHNGLKNESIPAINVPGDFPVIFEHLKKFLPKCKERADQGDHWTNLRNCAYLKAFEREKIVWAEIVFDSAFYYDAEGHYVEATGFMMTGENIKSLVALLNSRLLTYAFKNYFSGGDLRGNTFRYKKAFLEQLPVIKTDAGTRGKLEGLVDQIQYAKRADPAADTTALEREIDQLVYKLYDLTPEEIAVVEESTRAK